MAQLISFLPYKLTLLLHVILSTIGVCLFLASAILASQRFWLQRGTLKLIIAASLTGLIVGSFNLWVITAPPLASDWINNWPRLQSLYLSAFIIFNISNIKALLVLALAWYVHFNNRDVALTFAAGALTYTAIFATQLLKQTNSLISWAALTPLGIAVISTGLVMYLSRRSDFRQQILLTFCFALFVETGLIGGIAPKMQNFELFQFFVRENIFRFIPLVFTLIVKARVYEKN